MDPSSGTQLRWQEDAGYGPGGLTRLISWVLAHRGTETLARSSIVAVRTRRLLSGGVWHITGLSS